MSGLKPSPATVRVYVPTYRRHTLLPRALGSLRAQTFSDWVCEVHNDDPTDVFPKEYIRSLSDPRIVLRQHDRNYGPTATFNLFYRPVEERYYSILEDDNWWEPEFLTTMVRELELHPTVTMAWCNQKLWEEQPDQSWRSTGRLVYSPEDLGYGLVQFGDFRQIAGAMHANGAMLIRSRPNEIYATPDNFPFAPIEAFRERLIPHPLIYIAQPLANYAFTLQTARRKSLAEWYTAYTILSAAFLKHAGKEFPFDRLMSESRNQQPPGTNPFLLAAIVEPGCRGLLRYATAKDWFVLLRSLLARPSIFWSVWGSRWRHASWWDIIDRATIARFAEAKSKAAVSLFAPDKDPQAAP